MSDIIFFLLFSRLFYFFMAPNTYVLSFLKPQSFLKFIHVDVALNASEVLLITISRQPVSISQFLLTGEKYILRRVDLLTNKHLDNIYLFSNYLCNPSSWIIRIITYISLFVTIVLFILNVLVAKSSVFVIQTFPLNL